jgi:hypothetical protein
MTNRQRFFVFNFQILFWEIRLNKTGFSLAAKSNLCLMRKIFSSGFLLNKMQEREQFSFLLEHKH